MDGREDFLISYAPQDQRWAEWIAWQLEADGYVTHLKAWDVQPGENIVLGMDTILKRTRYVLPVLSPDYSASQLTSAEWTVAFQHKQMLPVRVRPCEIEGILGSLLHIDLVDQDEQTAHSLLLAGAQRKRRKPDHLPTFPGSSPASSSSPAFPGALPSLWCVPYPRNPYFLGRDELLSRVATLLRSEHTAAVSQRLAMSGLGGIGKTQIALEYVYRYYQDYQAVLWTEAEKREDLMTGYLTFAQLLHLPQNEKQDQLAIVQAVKDWLQTHTSWLLILDNADDLILAREFFPAAAAGHILLTTRASSMGRLATPLEVDTFDQEIGALFLLRRASLLAGDTPLQQASPQDVILARKLTQKMGGLPLALDQAGAYIEETQCSLQDYLNLYQCNRTELLKERRGNVSDHPDPVVTTWSLSFKKIEQRDPAAADLLRVCAFLQPDAIPEELILEGAAHLGPHLQTINKNLLLFNQAIQTILSYSLIQRNSREHLLSIHRLVQAVLKDGMDQRTQQVWIERTILALAVVLPQFDHQSEALYARCLVHAQGCIPFIEQFHLTSQATLRLLHQTAIYLAEHARYSEAEQLYRQKISILERISGSDHSQVASLNDLANLYCAQGRYTEAEPLYQRALSILEQALGPDHAEVAFILHNLAILYQDQGRYRVAESLYLRTLRIWEQTLDPAHLWKAALLHNLAALYQQQGRYDEAGSLYLRALHMGEQVFGSDHPEITFSLNGLANLYILQGKYREAESFCLRALHIREQVLDPTHPNVASSLHLLANLYKQQGKYSEAEPLYQRALSILEQVLDPTHPDLAFLLHNLANLYNEQKKYTKAKQFYQRALRIREQTPGSQSPLTHYILYSLASVYENQGKYTKAKQFYQRALRTREQTLGPQHPLTQSTANDLIAILREMGREAEAQRIETHHFASNGVSESES